MQAAAHFQRHCRVPYRRHAITGNHAQLQHAPPAPIARGRVVVAGGLDLASLGLDVPDIDGDLRSIQTELGATFNADGVALTFGNARQAVEALGSGVCLVDRSHWPRLRLSGRDRLPLLQRFSTQDFSNITPGQGCDTALIDSQGHLLDLATAYISDSHVLLVVSPGAADSAVSWLQAAAAAAELKVSVQDVSQRSVLITLVGPESVNVLKELGGEGLVSGLGSNYGSHMLLKFSNTPLLAAVGCGLAVTGYTLIADESVSGELFSVFAAKGCILMGQQEWDCVRTLSGRPALGAEMGPDVEHSPLEAGLYHAVSLRKTIGCEGLQALAVAEAAGQGSQLWGLELQSQAAPGAVITVEGEYTGTVTSSTTTPTGEHFALGFIKTASGAKPTISAGMPAQVEGSRATIATIPFASRQFLADVLASTSAAQAAVALGPGAEVLAEQAAQQRLQQAQEAERAEQERLQRRKEDAARLAAWQAKQLGGLSMK